MSDSDQLYVETSCELAAAHFDLAASPEVKIADDPASGETWQQVRIQVRGSAASVQNAHRAYTNAWLKLVPAERARDVRLAIRIVQGLGEQIGRRLSQLSEITAKPWAADCNKRARNSP